MLDRTSLFAGMGLGGALVLSGLALGGLSQPGPEEPAPVIEAPPEDVSLGVVTARELRVVDKDGKIGARLYMHPGDVEGFVTLDMYDDDGELANRIWVNNRGHGYGFYDMVRFQEAQIVNRKNELMGRVHSMEDHGEVSLYNFREQIVARLGASFRGGGVFELRHNNVPEVQAMATPLGGQVNTRLPNARRLTVIEAEQKGGVMRFLDRETGKEYYRVPPAQQPTEGSSEPAKTPGANQHNPPPDEPNERE